MKSETPTPQPTQWAIDPALQQLASLSTQQGASRYYPSTYPYYYQQPQTSQTPPAPTTPAAPAASTSTATQKNAGASLDTSDIATLNDALGSAGVDLRAEEESLQKSHDSQLAYRNFQDRTHTQPSNVMFNTHFIGTTVRSIATDSHKLTKPISEDAINYLALALRMRLQDLLKSMIAASEHRTDATFDRPASFYEDTESPMWSLAVRRDVSKQLAALEKVEREEELKTRRERKERADMAAAQLAALQASGNGSMGSSFPSGDSLDDELSENPKKKRKKDGPGVTAKNMSEDVRKQMSNLVANQASGMGKKYAWMTASNANVAPRAKKDEASKTAASSPVTTTPRSTWSKPYVSTATKAKEAQEASTPAEDDNRTRITMRDAMFVIEKERGHGGGRGAALGWT